MTDRLIPATVNVDPGSPLGLHQKLDDEIRALGRARMSLGTKLPKEIFDALGETDRNLRGFREAILKSIADETAAAAAAREEIELQFPQ